MRWVGQGFLRKKNKKDCVLIAAFLDSMYRGRRATIRIRFIPTLLDTMIERFGTTFAYYAKPDERHYSVEAEIEISDQFYGWLLGFGKRVKLVRPEEEVESFKAYLDKVRSNYE